MQRRTLRRQNVVGRVVVVSSVAGSGKEGLLCGDGFAVSE